ncbi:MAG: (Fe-S)-binding protein [Rhodobiaceae bacterium]|nr:(Fe-S)-binding protein [Rhodobiaceae bacterium]MCC0054899.1 (Fe-S)-binding protein [Rhodobiaceae bacterium]
MPASDKESPRRVALFVTCLVDLMRPVVGFAAVKLLGDAGCIVEVPGDQTCCGQPAWNSGDRADAQAIARKTIALLEKYDHVVVPSGSCAGMIARHYPEMFSNDLHWRGRAERLAAKTHELTSFLTDVLGVGTVEAAFDGAVTYHDSCAGLRELGIREQPRRLLAGVDGLSLTELADSEACCGFGGTFCVKYPDISTAIVDRKIGAVAASGADTLLAGDLGCLMNMAGRLSREGHTVKVRHVAEVLAGMAGGPAIGEGAGKEGKQ